MRFLGYLFLLLAIGALVLDVLAMGDGAFTVRSLSAQIADLQLGDVVAPVADNAYGAMVLAWPGVVVLGGVGIAFLILSSLFSSSD